MYDSCCTQPAGLGAFGSLATATFDSDRQKLWEEYAALLDMANPQLAAGQFGGLLGYMAGLQSIMDRHVAAYNKAKAAGAGTSWLDPRFNDFQSVYNAKMAEWRVLLGQATGGAPQALPSPSITYPSDLSAPTQLVITGSGVPTPSGGIPGAAPSYGGGSPYADLFGNETGQAAPGTQTGAGVPSWALWAAAGLAAAFLLRR